MLLLEPSSEFLSQLVRFSFCYQCEAEHNFSEKRSEHRFFPHIFLFPFLISNDDSLLKILTSFLWCDIGDERDNNISRVAVGLINMQTAATWWVKRQFIVCCDGSCSEVLCFRLCIVPVTVHLYNCTSVPVFVDVDTQAGHGRSVVMMMMLFSSIQLFIVPFECLLYFWWQYCHQG